MNIHFYFKNNKYRRCRFAISTSKSISYRFVCHVVTEVGLFDAEGEVLEWDTDI